MANKQVWIVSTKSEPLEGCSIDMDGCDFYFAEAFVPVESDALNVTSLESIVNRVRQALLNERLLLADISKCLRYKEEEWGTESAMDKEVHVMAQKAFTADEVKLGGFRPEEIEQLCQYHHSMNELNA